jgi:hypothetical protein
MLLGLWAGPSAGHRVAFCCVCYCYLLYCTWLRVRPKALREPTRPMGCQCQSPHRNLFMCVVPRCVCVVCVSQALPAPCGYIGSIPTWRYCLGPTMGQALVYCLHAFTYGCWVGCGLPSCWVAMHPLACVIVWVGVLVWAYADSATGGHCVLWSSGVRSSGTAVVGPLQVGSTCCVSAGSWAQLERERCCIRHNLVSITVAIAKIGLLLPPVLLLLLYCIRASPDHPCVCQKRLTGHIVVSSACVSARAVGAVSTNSILAAPGL